MAKRDIRSLTPTSTRPMSIRTLLQQAQTHFYTEVSAALSELRDEYMDEVHRHSLLLRQKGLTFEKDEKTAWRKAAEVQEARLEALNAQLQTRTESIRRTMDAERVSELHKGYCGSDETSEEEDVSILANALQEEESLTYSKDSTPAVSPKPQSVFLSVSEVMAARLQDLERKDRMARQQALAANQKWVG